MKKIALLLSLFALAACGSKQEAAPAATATATATASAKPSLPAPDQGTFTALFDKECPKVEKVTQAVCKRAGFGSDNVTCKYALGEDKYMRDEATLVPGDGGWVLDDAKAECGKHMDHHAG